MDDSALMNLAEAASAALVDAAATDEWERVRDVVVRLFARSGVDGRRVERRLDATRDRVMEDQRFGWWMVRWREVERWRTRFADLLDDDPEAADDLQALLEIHSPPTAAPGYGGGWGGSGGSFDDDDFDDDVGSAAYLGQPGQAPLLEDTGEHVVPELQVHDPVSRAIQALRPGLLAFNPPAEMTQGRKERVEVAIAGSAELRDALIAGLEGRGQVRIEEVGRTSRFMGVELSGEAFEIVPLSPAEQVVDPTARWQFNVRPLRVGLQTLTLSASLQLGIPEVPSGTRIAVPVFESEIRIRVSLSYGTRSFIGSNWQWLVGTGIGAGGTAAAFLLVFH